MLYRIKNKYYQVEKGNTEMSILLNAQFSVFSNNHIEPTADIMEALLKRINVLGRYTFLPNILAGQNIDIAAGVIKPVNNISFVTMDHLIQIACMDERIDVTFNMGKDYSGTTIEDFLEFASDVLYYIMKDNRVYSNRLAINISLLSDIDVDDIKNTKLGRKMCTTLDFYDDSQIEEWSTRTNTRKRIDIGQDEMLNIITDISLAKETTTNNKKFLCHMDINTIQENVGFRFSYENLNDFKNNVLSIINTIKADYEELTDNV